MVNLAATVILLLSLALSYQRWLCQLLVLIHFTNLVYVGKHEKITELLQSEYQIKFTFHK